MTPTDDHDNMTTPADETTPVALTDANSSPSAEDSSDSLEAGAAEVAHAAGNRPSDVKQPAHEATRPEKPSYRGEVVFLCVVLVLTMFFSLAGVPGEPEKVVTDGSDALRKGWMEERLLEYYRGPQVPEGEVILTESVPGDGQALKQVEGTWLDQALRAQTIEPEEPSGDAPPAPPEDG